MLSHLEKDNMLKGNIMRKKFYTNNIQLLAIIFRITPGHTLLVILIRFITIKNNWMNLYAKTEGKRIYSKNTDELPDEGRRM